KTIHASGTDLLNLINEVLDLSKVEAGEIEIYASDVKFAGGGGDLERGLRAGAQQKSLRFTLAHEKDTPDSADTDGQRLQQILRTLLANAFKFTEKGSIDVRIAVVPTHGQFTHPILVGEARVLSLAVHDTGIGIAKEMHQHIFEPFQQADGTTSRK